MNSLLANLPDLASKFIVEGEEFYGNGNEHTGTNKCRKIKIKG